MAWRGSGAGRAGHGRSLNGASRPRMRRGTTADVLTLARRGVLLAIGSGALLAETSGRLLAYAATTGEAVVRAARSVRLPMIAFGSLERKR